MTKIEQLEREARAALEAAVRARKPRKLTAAQAAAEAQARAEYEADLSLPLAR